MRLGVALLWIAFAAVVAVAAYQLLLACDLGTPIFGFRYCRSRQAAAFREIETQAEMRRSLRARLRTAELRAAGLPICKFDHLVIPARLEDLQGCWESDRGDTDVFTDDDAMKFVARRRTCLCFEGGEGRVRMAYSNGAKCEGPLTAKLQTGQFTVRFPNVPCSDGGQYVSTEVICSNKEGSASRDWRTQGYRRRVILADKFHRVEAARCQSY